MWTRHLAAADAISFVQTRDFSSYACLTAILMLNIQAAVVYILIMGMCRNYGVEESGS
jgi:hypothetical protein